MDSQKEARATGSRVMNPRSADEPLARLTLRTQETFQQCSEKQIQKTSRCRNFGSMVQKFLPDIAGRKECELAVR